jgi:hypothetical protein
MIMDRPTLHSRRWLILTAVMLLAALARFPALDRVPPGWRDDELIEIGMDTRIQQGWRPLYIREAEGHEPLYHYLHAGTLALFGHNTLGYRWLPAAFGTLSTALLIVLVWRLLGFNVAALAGAFYGVGLWPVLYSRFGVRHMGVMPFILLALYALAQISNIKCQMSKGRWLNLRFGIWHLRFSIWYLGFSLLAGIAIGIGLYVYYAAWVMPAVVVALAAYLLLFDRQRFRRVWPGLALALVVAGVIFSPLGWELVHGPKVTRIEVTGAPVRALFNGDPLPVIQTTLGTLGMFTFAGDPEWLYNLSGLPVFDWITGILFYLGFVVCLLRLRDVRYGFVLVWLALGLAPAFISVPPASFSHTIAAQGAVYLMPAIGLIELSNLKSQISNLKRRAIHLKFEIWNLIFIALIAWTALYTVHFYFGQWPNEWWTRFLYHADTHDLARWLDAQREGGDIAISTASNELQLEPCALSFDLKRRDIAPRFFDPEWALVFPLGGGQRIALTSYPSMNPLLESAFQSTLIAEYYNPAAHQLAFRVYRDMAAPGSRRAASGDAPQVGNLTLVSHTVAVAPPGGGDGILLTTWRVDGPLSDPLKLFVHLLDANGQVIGNGDRLDVLASSLHPGDVFIQINRLPRPADATCAPCRIELGLYNPMTNERLPASTGDHIVLPVEATP